MNDLPTTLRKVALFDGPYWDGRGEVHLFYENADGDPVDDIPWGKDWPQVVDRAFLEQRGFRVETA